MLNIFMLLKFGDGVCSLLYCRINLNFKLINDISLVLENDNSMTESSKLDIIPDMCGKQRYFTKNLKK